MTLQLIRFDAESERQSEVDDAIAELFAAVATAGPDGIGYLALRAADVPSYQLLLHLADGADNPLPAIPSAARFRERVADWTGGPRPPQRAVLLGSYGAFA